MILADILVFVVIYFVTMLAVVGRLDAVLLLPFLGWLVLYVAALVFFVPRLAHVAKEQADARSLMTGRITDAYTNISTVKLFSHAHREAGFARSAMQEFMGAVHGQMRLVTGFEIVNHVLSMLLIASTAGATMWLWVQGQVGVGAVAAATAMALRLNGISHWVMWEFSALFEHIGTVQDGINTIARPHAIVDRAGAVPLVVRQGELRFEDVRFSYGAKDPEAPRVIDGLSLRIRAGEKIGLVGRSGAGKSTVVNLLLRFYDVEGGCIRIDGQDIAQVTQDSLRAQVGMVTQDTSLLHRSVRDNILYGRPDATDADMVAAAQRAEAHDFIRGLTDPKGRTGYDAHVGERGGQALGRAAPAHRHRPRDAEGRAHPAARRSHQRARQRGRGRDPGEPVPADGRQDGGGDRAPAVDHCRDGPPDRARQGPHRGGRRSPRAAAPWRALCAAVGPPERRLPRRGTRRRRGRRRARRRHHAAVARLRRGGHSVEELGQVHRRALPHLAAVAAQPLLRTLAAECLQPLEEGQVGGEFRIGLQVGEQFMRLDHMEMRCAPAAARGGRA